MTTKNQPPTISGRYSVTTTVLQSPDHGPQLCLGGVAESYPPQCGGPDIVGWDWNEVADKESANGTTWGTYRVVGTWDGQRLTLTEAASPPGPGDPPPVDFATPCDPPSGGWGVVDRATATRDGQDAATAYARAQSDFAGAWVDQSINPASGEDPVDEMAMNDPERLVLNLRFTGDRQRHVAEVRAVWGGALCITKADRSLRELEAVRDELQEELEPLGSSIDEVRGVVEITTVVPDEELQKSLDDRYGAKIVALTGALQPAP